MLLGFQKFKFNLIYEDSRIWWCNFSSNSHSWNILFNFSVKLKIIILEHKFSQLSQILKIFSRDLIRLSFSRASSNTFKSNSCGILVYSPKTYVVTSIGFSERFTIISKRSNSLLLLLGKAGIGKTFIRNPRKLMFNLTKEYFQVRVARWWTPGRLRWEKWLLTKKLSRLIPKIALQSHAATKILKISS